MVNSQGKTALVIILVVVVLITASFYIGRYTQNDNSEQIPVSDVADTALTGPVASDSAMPSVNPFEQRPFSPQPTTIASPITPKADVEIREEADGKVYTDNKHGFSYKFSKTLILNNSASDVNFAQFLEFQKGTGNVVRMVMQIFENPQNSTLEEIVKREKLLSSDELGPKFESFQINGHDALKLTKTMTQNEICNDGDGSTKDRIFYFLVKGAGYVVEIHPNDACESFKRNWFDITPQTFRFVN